MNARLLKGFTQPEWDPQFDLRVRGRKLKPLRHNADDRYGLPVKTDDRPGDSRIGTETCRPPTDVFEAPKKSRVDPRQSPKAYSVISHLINSHS